MRHPSWKKTHEDKIRIAGIVAGLVFAGVSYGRTTAVDETRKSIRGRQFPYTEIE